MDCIDLFKKAAAALQTDPRYLELDAARRENDMDEELQNMIGEFNLARLDLNNESAKAETDAARVAELNQRVNDLYSQIMASEGMVRYNAAKAECEAMVSHIDAIINTAMNGGDPMTVQAPPAAAPAAAPPAAAATKNRQKTKRGCAKTDRVLFAKAVTSRKLVHRTIERERG
mgnify:CR=1 FL=1